MSKSLIELAAAIREAEAAYWAKVVTLAKKVAHLDGSFEQDRALTAMGIDARFHNDITSKAYKMEVESEEM